MAFRVNSGIKYPTLPEQIVNHSLNQTPTQSKPVIKHKPQPVLDTDNVIKSYNQHVNSLNINIPSNTQRLLYSNMQCDLPYDFKTVLSLPIKKTIVIQECTIVSNAEFIEFEFVHNNLVVYTSTLVNKTHLLDIINKSLLIEKQDGTTLLELRVKSVDTNIQTNDVSETIEHAPKPCVIKSITLKYLENE